MRKSEENGTPELTGIERIAAESTARRGGPGPYVRTDFVDRSLQARVEALAEKAGVKPGTILERLAADHLKELEEKPGLLAAGKVLDDEKRLLAQLQVLQAKKKELGIE